MGCIHVDSQSDNGCKILEGTGMTVKVDTKVKEINKITNAAIIL
jgi:hypothetical protein